MEIPHIGRTTHNENYIPENNVKIKLWARNFYESDFKCLVETRWDFMVKRDGYSINLHPSPKLISSAFMALIESFGWDSFTILYQVEIWRVNIYFKKLTWVNSNLIQYFIKNIIQNN